MAYFNFMNQQRAMLIPRAMKMSHSTPIPRMAAKDEAAIKDPAMIALRSHFCSKAGVGAHGIFQFHEPAEGDADPQSDEDEP